MSFAHKLTPAYRHGADTPWGGEALRAMGLSIPDGRTGEALIASTLPGLESRAEDGRTLTELAGAQLPILIKLIDAREALSVQVHPDDGYAAAHENGKLGKTEAWLVLKTQPGAKLVYGLSEGTDVRALCGKEIEPRLRWVDVRPGDALFIPAGTVHAIGAGIVLYEVQQSSDVTYRFWDWDRRDSAGNPRALHWDKACDVADAKARLDVSRGTTQAVGGGSRTRYISNPLFTLDMLRVRGGMPLPDARGARFLTALCEGELACGGDVLSFVRGDTIYLPKESDGVSVVADGDVIVGGV